MRPERQATSPLLWVATQFGQFLSDGYREIRALIASNTPHSLKKVFTGSLLALILALLAVIVIASQIHPARGHSCGCMRAADRLRRNSIPKVGAIRRLFPVWLHTFHWRWPDYDVPLEKEYPLLAKVIAVVLFVVLCMRYSGPAVDETEAEIAAGGGAWLRATTE